MKTNSLLYLLLFLGLPLFVNAQNSIPVISSSTDLIDIRDGDDVEIYQGAWSLDFKAKPDVYGSSNIGESVTFFTDIDSISFVIHPDSVYDFVILYNERDSAYTQIVYEPSYLDILKKAGDFDFNEKPEIPEFTYQDSSDQILKTLRKEFNLDSIAGNGNEIFRIINLLHWVHDIIPHDGNHANPVVKNAMSMISECKKDERGLNCRGLATILNECYLSLGIKSRIITCMPKDSIFQECHAFNMVFSNDLDKWIWIDPTNDAYVMDENGVLLGLDEVRYRLINGGTLILNPDANWNHKFSVVKENYLFEYMAKNLYRFSCPLRSEYDYETRVKGKNSENVELIPLDGYKQTPKVSERTNKEIGVTFKTYKTNNPDAFWVKPK